jgi:ribosomal-protein-alanine N-acetyltransferase
MASGHYIPPLRLTTDRLTLRVPTLSDARAIYEGYASDPSVVRFLLWQLHESLEETRYYLARVHQAWKSGGPDRPWVIERTDNGELLGMVGTVTRGHAVELGYVLKREAWGQGYMTEAVRGVTHDALETQRVWRVFATAHVDNASSHRVLEKAGFQREGLLRRLHIHPVISEEPQDALLYSRIR